MLPTGSLTGAAGNCAQIGELLRLHDASCATIDERGEDLSKLETELSVQRRANEGLQDDVASEQDEARKWRTQLEMAREEHRREKSKLVKENKGLEKERARLQGKDTQWAAKLRKAESESSRLKDTLQKMHSTQKGRKDKGVAMARTLPATRGGRGGGQAGEGQQMLDSANEAYTETLAELRNENECLRASLATLQQELTTACNEATGASEAEQGGAEADGAPEGATVSGTMLLPVEYMQDGMEQQIRELVTSVSELLSSAASQGSGPMESPSIARQRTNEVTELTEQLDRVQTEAGRVQAALTAKTERLEETERMCALLRDQAHKQLGGTDAAEAIRQREIACDEQERRLAAQAESLSASSKTNEAAAARIDADRAALEADSAAVQAHLAAWEKGSVGPAGTPLAPSSDPDKENAPTNAGTPSSSPAVRDLLRRLSGLSAPKASPVRSSRKAARPNVTPHKTSTMLPLSSPKVRALHLPPSRACVGLSTGWDAARWWRWRS